MVADVYSAFALAFKKPAGVAKEAFFFEVSDQMDACDKGGVMKLFRGG